MNTPPPNFNHSKNDSTPNFKKSTKKVKFDKSVDLQQLEMNKEREHQKRIQAELDLQSMNERIEQFKIDEMFRRTNGVPFEGNFDSPIPMDPFQKDAEIFGNSSPRFNKHPLNFESSNFNSSIAGSPISRSSFSSSKPLTKSPRISSLYKMQSTNFQNSSFKTSAEPYSTNIFSSSNAFNNSKPSFDTSIQIQPSSNLNSSRALTSNLFRSSFKNSSSSNQGFNDSFKTALCFEYRNTQQCSHGDNCRYAHGINELRLPPGLPQPKMCKYFLQGVPCPFGPRCRFVHHYQNAL
uniref:C3H1-type domain-containing protein n=1 Tax=Panagrolaimus sp. ES5 TaxID=591445 RepID=A0AC34FFP6_9BILA